MNGGSAPRPCLLIDKMNGKVVRRYWSISDAARGVGMTRGGAEGQALRRNLPEGRYMLRLERDWQGFEVFGKGRNKPVLLTDGDRWRWLPNSKRAARLLGVSACAVSAAIKSGEEIRGVWAKYAESTREWGEIRREIEARQGEKGKK